VQRGHETADEPGGQRAHDYGERGDAQMRAAHEEDVLTAMLINDPATVAELRELYPRYEQALVSNDVET
jgi:hypothetical protein